MNGGGTTPARSGSNVWPFSSSDPLALPSEYTVARQAGDTFPVRLHDGQTAHLVARHGLVVELLRHPALSAKPDHPAYPAPTSGSLRTKQAQRALVRLDPPEHTGLRRALMPSLSPAVVSSMRHDIEGLSRRLVDLALTQGRCDVVTQVADPLPLLVACAWLGVGEDDALRLGRAAKTLATLSRDKTRATAEPDAIEVYFSDQLARTGGAGWCEAVVSLIQSLERHGVSADAHASALSHLFTSSLSTVSNTLSLTFLALSRFIDQRIRLTESGSADLSKAVEEVLRFTCVPRHSVLRTATADIEVGTAVIRKGSGVIASVAAANRDPGEFEAPDRFDLARTPNRHLTFGPGTHGCIGSALARMELAAVLDAIASHPMATRRWTPEVVEHHMGTTITVDRLILRVDGPAA